MIDWRPRSYETCTWAFWTAWPRFVVDARPSQQQQQQQAGVSTSSSDLAVGLSSLGVDVRQLTVVELCVAEHAPASAHSVRAVAGGSQLAEAKRAAGLNMSQWMKAHRSLRALPVE